jgi:hypothetical protein
MNLPRKLFPLSILLLIELSACGNPTPPPITPAPFEQPNTPIIPTLVPTAVDTHQSPVPTAPPSVTVATDIPAFPGADGFGAIATGGRGGVVIYVTTLDPDPEGQVEGSLNWALRQAGPRTILFKVSGVIDSFANVVHGNVTIAGQTSPGGIIVRGIVCDGHYERNDCSNLIIRHVHSRPAPDFASRSMLDDALRLDGLNTFIIDHGSFANAVDEAIQISWASNGTIQNSVLGETVGEHFDRGGMLINYSHSGFPQDNLSIIRNLFYRIGGRLPELDCELSGYNDEPPEVPSDCAAHPLNIEISNNLIWDPGLPMWYNAPVDPGGDLGMGLFNVNLNYVNNYVVARSDYGQPMVISEFLNQSNNALYVSGNKMNLYPNFSDYELFYCCNDFNVSGPNTDLGIAQRRETRFDFPMTDYLPADQLVLYMIGNVGAFPRNPLDNRYINSLITNTIDPTPLDRPAADDALTLAYEPNREPEPPLDSDNDGMPDDWETAHGLNPNADDHNGTALSMQMTGVNGYTNLECYLNELADKVVTGTGGP